MSVHELLKQADLPAALAAQKKTVQANPANSKERFLLYQLFAFNGEWDRASTQLSVAMDMDDKQYGLLGKIHQTLIKFEIERKEIFAGKRTPLIFGKPFEWMIQLIQALVADSEGDFESAKKLRESALEKAEPSKGALNNKPFNWISDTDGRLGPVIEAIVDGKYYWVPLNYVRALVITQPTQLSDYLWTPVKFGWQNGGTTEGYMPTLYAGTDASEDGQLKLGRKTEWAQTPSGCEIGIGQKTFYDESDDYPLLDIRTLTFDQDESLLEKPAEETSNGDEESAD